MASPEEATKAIEQFNETELKGRNIRVDQARPREGGGGGGGGGNRGGGFNRRGSGRW
jgi:RNA recognition motif-containing protein